MSNVLIGSLNVEIIVFDFVLFGTLYSKITQFLEMVLHKRVLLNGLVTISRQKQRTDLIMPTVIQQINNLVETNRTL